MGQDLVPPGGGRPMSTAHKLKTAGTLGVVCAFGAMLLVALPLSAKSSWREESGRQVRSVAVRRYAYAPAAITNAGHTYYYSCHNDRPGVIRDHVYFTQVDRPGRPPQRNRSVIRPGSGWDSKHICDPTVVAATVHYRRTTYRYVMFYLGTRRANTSNHIGVAFSKSLAGPWVKYPKPIVTNPYTNPKMWGVGQPSATTIRPKTGEILLFYSQGGPTTGGYRRHLTLGDMAKPKVGPAKPITNAGLVRADGKPDVLHNFDVAYNPSRKRFFAIREQGPQPKTQPSHISAQVEIVSIAEASIWKGGGAWTSEGRITRRMTGFPRNHNPGILRTVHGTLPTPNALTAVFSVSTTGSFPASLWSYELWQVNGTLPARKHGPWTTSSAPVRAYRPE